MNILFLTLANINSIHDQNIYTDLLSEFIHCGHSVYIVSPQERRYRKDTHLIQDKQCLILKARVGNIQKTNLIEKGISTIRLERQFIKAINKHYSEYKFDLVLYSTPPITLVKAVDFIKKRDKAFTYLLLKDIFPQNAVDLGILSKSGITGLLYRYFRYKEKKLYELSDIIGCMSQANKEYVLKHNPSVPPGKVEVCPNTIIPAKIVKTDESIREIRRKYNIPLDCTVFIYGGNLGKPQGVDFIVRCLKENQDRPGVFFVIVGAGTDYVKLEQFMKKDQPENVLLLQQLPKEEYDKLVNSCDVGLIFLDHRFTIPNFPSRLLSYMQASIPVIAATDRNTDLGQVIVKGEFGIWCESKATDELYQAISALCDMELRRRMGENACFYLEKNYTAKQSYEIIINHIKGEQ